MDGCRGPFFPPGVCLHCKLGQSAANGPLRCPTHRPDRPSCKHEKVNGIVSLNHPHNQPHRHLPQTAFPICDRVSLFGYALLPVCVVHLREIGSD